MVMSFAVRNGVSKELEREYRKILLNMDLRELVNEFLSYLDYTEESDSGHVFNPITIGSCRCLMSQPLDMCMKHMRMAAAVK